MDRVDPDMRPVFKAAGVDLVEFGPAEKVAGKPVEEEFDLDTPAEEGEDEPVEVPEHRD